MPNRLRSYPIDVDATLAINAAVTADNSYYYGDMYTTTTTSAWINPNNNTWRVVSLLENINITQNDGTSMYVKYYNSENIEYIYDKKTNNWVKKEVKKKIEWIYDKKTNNWVKKEVKKKIEWIQEEMEL